eukprot:TRINITY_DN7194_c0_g1_i1.p1 TRINITY_DN7194_c0_g1~~TRINITY_DN7194_c0_g1_i1.p1  ORF type:complete len:191 (-),score=28.94 TRINITY_DN7194_c0_g1_i1:71-619(-)
MEGNRNENTKQHESSIEDHLLKIFNDQAPIARFTGMHLSFETIEDKITGKPFTSAVLCLPYKYELTTAFKNTHGGILATLLDSVMWFTAAHSFASKFSVPVSSLTSLFTSNLSVYYLRPAFKTNLKADTRVIKTGSSLQVIEGRIWDENNSLIAHGLATFSFAPKTNTPGGSSASQADRSKL